MMPPQGKKKYLQVFKTDYTNEFPFIRKSNKSVNHAFCTDCSSEINIGHGGKNDIVRHIGMKKHIDSANSLQKTVKISSFFETGSNVVKAECLFTAFLMEHNLPLSCADHVGPLLRKMCPDSEIAKKYSCARTKTSCIISEWASCSQMNLIAALQSQPFSLATDGSNDSNSKLFPIVATYFDEKMGKINYSLLAIPILKGDGTGVNIGNLMLDKLNELNIPITNCIAFSSDNAAVMVGSKTGVVAILKEHQKNLISVGCPCHLLNLAAEKGSLCLPLNVDELLVDLFYYFKKSTKRKEKLNNFQELYNDDVKHILKHVATRWLSTTKCLQRLLLLWEPLIAFFKCEIDSRKTKSSSSSLAYYTIPKKNVSNSVSEGHPCSSEGKNLKRKKDYSDNHMVEPSQKFF